jgi:hypothetical protein
MVNMKKIISIILIGMMTVGCGKTARLEKLGRKVAEEQARLEAVRLANRSSWEKFKDGFWKHPVSYSLLTFTAVVVGTYHFRATARRTLE